MDKMRKMSILWGFIVIVLVAGLSFLGFTYKYKSKKYKDLENKLVEIAKKYTATDFNYPKGNNSVIVTYEELKEKKLINELKVNNNKCDGYVEITFDGVTKYKAFIDCKNYKTHNYDKSKME